MSSRPIWSIIVFIRSTVASFFAPHHIKISSVGFPFLDISFLWSEDIPTLDAKSSKSPPMAPLGKFSFWQTSCIFKYSISRTSAIGLVSGGSFLITTRSKFVYKPLSQQIVEMQNVHETMTSRQCKKIKNKTKAKKCHSVALYSSNNRNECSNCGDISTLFQSHSQTKWEWLWNITTITAFIPVVTWISSYRMTFSAFVLFFMCMEHE